MTMNTLSCSIFKMDYFDLLCSFWSSFGREYLMQTI